MRRSIAPAAAIAAVALLSACGQRAALEPRPGQRLPVAPIGAAEPKTVDELLEPTPQAAPITSSAWRPTSANCSSCIAGLSSSLQRFRLRSARC